MDSLGGMMDARALPLPPAIAGLVREATGAA
jgi:hypothetical protein